MTILDGDISNGNEELSYGNLESQGNMDDTKCLSNSYSILVSLNSEESMSEQDIREILLEAGYAIEEIIDIITKARSNESACFE